MKNKVLKFSSLSLMCTLGFMGCATAGKVNVENVNIPTEALAESNTQLVFLSHKAKTKDAISLPLITEGPTDMNVPNGDYSVIFLHVNNPLGVKHRNEAQAGCYDDQGHPLHIGDTGKIPKFKISSSITTTGVKAFCERVPD